MPKVISKATTIPQTEDYICREILQGCTSSVIAQLVASTANSPDPVKAAFNWIWEHVSYSPDPYDKQRLKTVSRIVETGLANCANYCIIMGAYLCAIGQSFLLRVTGYGIDRTPEHIYIVWNGIALDLTAGQQPTRVKPMFGFEFKPNTYQKDYAFYPHATLKNINNKGRLNYCRQCL
jgi:hypothetical protein